MLQVCKVILSSQCIVSFTAQVPARAVLPGTPPTHSEKLTSHPFQLLAGASCPPGNLSCVPYMRYVTLEGKASTNCNKLPSKG